MKTTKLLLVFFIVLFALDSSAQTKTAKTEAGSKTPPNVIVFIADDMGWEASSPYGNDVIHTPNIQKMADEGMRFNNFFLTASSCSPSRVSILSGLYPHQTGAMNLHENISPEVPLVVDKLHEKNYYTMLVGKSHGTNNKKVQQKFDYMKKVNWGKPWLMGSDWVNALKKRPKDKPFFMWAASIDPHRPFEQGEYPYHHDPAKVIIPPYYPDLPEIREDLADYYDEISRFDKHIGMAVAELKREGILDNTLIIIMSDNGKAFAQAKTRVNAPGLKSPLIIRYPKLIKKASTSDVLVSAVDISPTILDLTGAPQLKNGEGHPLTGTFSNPAKKIRDRAYAEHNWHSNMAFERAVISLDYLYIKNWLPELPATPPGDVVRPDSYQVMQKAYDAGTLAEEYSDSFYTPRPIEELFSLNEDLVNMKSLSFDPAFAKALLDNRIALAQWQYNTKDIFPGRENLKKDIIDRKTGIRLDNKDGDEGDDEEK